MDQSSRNKKKKGNSLGNVISIIIFVAIFSQFFSPALIQNIIQSVSQFVGQTTGLQIGTSLGSWIPILIIGFIVLSIVWSVVTAIGRNLGRNSEMPSPMSTTTVSRPTSSGQSASYNNPSPSGKLGSSTYNTSTMNNAARQQQFPPGVHLGQADPNAAFSSYSRLPRGINMEIPRGVNMEQVSKAATPNRYKTPGFEPVIDGKILGYGLFGLLLITGVLGFGVWLAGTFTGMLP